MSTSPSFSAALQQLGQAIAVEEGYGASATNAPTRLNNPGDLTDGNGNLLSFSSPQAGYNALDQQLQDIVNGSSQYYSTNETLSQFANTYTNGDPNAANTIAQQLGATPDATLAQVLGLSAAQPSTNAASTTTTQTNTPAGSSNATKTSSSIFPNFLQELFGAYLDRSVAIILGIIFIATGLLAFKQTQTIIKTVGTAAEIAA